MLQPRPLLGTSELSAQEGRLSTFSPGLGRQLRLGGRRPGRLLKAGQGQCPLQTPVPAGTLGKAAAVGEVGQPSRQRAPWREPCGRRWWPRQARIWGPNQPQGKPGVSGGTLAATCPTALSGGLAPPPPAPSPLPPSFSQTSLHTTPGVRSPPCTPPRRPAPASWLPSAFSGSAAAGSLDLRLRCRVLGRGGC